jgi:polyphosphate kinase
VPGLSERIRVISVVGRFLEHNRIFVFWNDGDPQYYVGSADWMTRNLRRRVEAVVKVEDAACKAELESIMRTYLADNCQAWEMDGTGAYERRRPVEGEEPRSAHDLLMRSAAATGDN